MRILCAVDGSECSQWGVHALEALAGREPEDVTLLHVVDPSALRAGRGRNPVAEKRALAAMEKAGGILLREAERSARVALGQAATSPRTTLHRALAHGPLAQTIVRQARRVKADLILIGSRGLSDIRGFLLGSISRQIASNALPPASGIRYNHHPLLGRETGDRLGRSIFIQSPSYRTGTTGRRTRHETGHDIAG